MFHQASALLELLQVPFNWPYRSQTTTPCIQPSTNMNQQFGAAFVVRQNGIMAYRTYLHTLRLHLAQGKYKLLQEPI